MSEIIDSDKLDVPKTTQLDSLGTTRWREYLTSGKLLAAWAPPLGSPYGRFMKVKTIQDVEKWKDQLHPRYTREDMESQVGISNLLRNNFLSKSVAVVMDSGGAHSVAMAVFLSESGYQPIIMFDTFIAPKAKVKAEQVLASLLYFATKNQQLKDQGKVTADSPPVFVLDTHRTDFYTGKDNLVDNRYQYQEQDFPSYAELQSFGINKVVYVCEADQHGLINPEFQSFSGVSPDIKPVFVSWQNSGIEIYYTGVSPRNHAFF